MRISRLRSSLLVATVFAVAAIAVLAGNRMTAVSTEVATTCLQDEMPEAVARSFAVSSSGGFRAAFPKAGGTPELDSMNGDLTVVVYQDGYPGVIWTDAEGAAGGRTVGHLPEPGTVDICVQGADGSTIVYANIPVE